MLKDTTKEITKSSEGRMGLDDSSTVMDHGLSIPYYEDDSHDQS
jgi:hypothetical protein